ncbi:hypothetical protein HDV05_008272, partial [Chytridiales sp. JEL 0842]
KGQRYEHVQVQVGLLSVSRVSFRLSIRILGSRGQTIALAEIGIVKTGVDGKAEEIGGAMKEGLERELRRQVVQAKL